MKTNKGFTLIELLVVIAIIGILSSVVLASLNTARTKGEDAAAKANLNNARAQAELFYDDHGNKYDTGAAGVENNLCTASDGIAGLLNAATTAVAWTGGTVGAACFASSTAWGAEVLLKTGDYYCVDSTGFAGVTDATDEIDDNDGNCNDN